ncbi:PAS domain S-box-containing protein [Methanolobus vulcani]|uniref:histidine kinase n=1 Tax=Methanolobus vulcani TaxID=38026 RepID=A0A7Z7FCD8_9EURY|nr:PAS domain S-box protein [Methanolobus vulcani]SDF66637.1 PAS domain S-box-containing protein [Methanolobus vulcani]
MIQGNSFSLLYDTTEQLVDIVASFFDAGLKNNECCLWGVAGQLDTENVKNLLRDSGLDVDRYVESGQLILSQCNECYIAGEGAVSDMDLLKWEEIYNIAMYEGYNGLRIVDKFTIVDGDSWDSFVEYEKKAMDLIRAKKITGLFAFLLEARSRMEMIELISMHDGTIIEKNGKWTLLQSSSSCKTVSRSQYFRDEILENVWTGFWAVDENDKIVFFNKGMESISGLSKSDVCGKRLTNFIPQSIGGDDPGFADVFQAVKEDLQSRSYDVFPFVKPDGQFIYHSGFLLPLTDDKGNYSGMIGTIGKLVEQTIDHETLRDKFKSIEKLEDIYRKSPVVAFLWSAEDDWPVAFVSENISQFGYTPEDLISGKMNYGDIIHPGDLDHVRTDVSELEVQGKMFFSKEYRLMTKSGKVRWVTERSHLIRDEKGDPAYYQGIIIDVTERKKAEETALASEKKYRLIFENSPLGIFHFNEKGIITHCNEKFLEIMALKSKEDIIGFDLGASIIDKDMKKAVDDALSRKQGFFEGEYHTVSTDITIYIKAYYSPNIAEDGSFLGGIGVFEDISEKKKAEDAVLEAEKKYRLIFENSPVGIFHFNEEGIVSHCNEKFLQIIGVENKDKVIGFNMVTQIHDEDMKKAISDVLSRKSGHFEGKYHTVISGKDLYLKADFSPNLADDGTLLGGIGIYGDVSIRKRAEEALRLDESRLEALLKISHVTDLSLSGVADFVQEEAVRLTQSKIGYLAFLNETATKLIIYSWSQSIMDKCKVKGKKLEYTIEETGLWGEPIRQKKAVIVNDFAAPNPLKHGYPKGHIRLRRYMSIPIFDGKKIVGVAGVGNKDDDYDKTDVRQLTLFMEGMWKLIQRQKSEDTLREYANELSKVNEELSKTNEELSQANEELKSLDRMKDDFLSNVSHEFKTPLTSIQGYSQLISDGTLGEVNEQQQKAVETVLRNSERLRRLVDSLLYLSRAQSGKLNYSFEKFSIKDILEHSVQDLALQAASKNIELVTDIPSDLPQLVLDRDKMMDVFVNLIDNAVKFTHDGGKVTVSAHVSEGSMYMDVEDTGIGIPEDKIPMLFQRFYQVDSSVKRRYGGTGLGLYICKKIVEDHKGDIYVSSEEGKGTTVHVRLPLEQ